MVVGKAYFSKKKGTDISNRMEDKVMWGGILINGMKVSIKALGNGIEIEKKKPQIRSLWGF